tara:strand:+ start:2095 stop:2295 length:201 start_codon:yes stop_codon:yes gene_type:complete
MRKYLITPTIVIVFATMEADDCPSLLDHFDNMGLKWRIEDEVPVKGSDNLEKIGEWLDTYYPQEEK